MVRMSNFMVAALNLVSFVVALAAIGISVHVNTSEASECQRVLQKPLLLVGVFLLVVSLMGLIGSACKVSWLLWIYLFMMFMLILGLFCFTVFTLVVTNKGIGKWVSGRGFYEYRFGDYSNWLKNYVVKDHWDPIRSCLVQTRYCARMPGRSVDDFYHAFLTPMQSGCCKPPMYCAYKFVNATFWEVPKAGASVDDTDCKTWSNNQQELCFNCNSCKGGVLANIKLQWRKLAIFNVCLLVLLTTVYSFGCCALRGNRNELKYRRYRAYP